MGRSPCCEKVGLKKGPWTPDEDQKLLAYIEENGHGSWRSLPIKAEVWKSCRLRWTNYLRPDIKRGKFSLQEEQTIIQLHALLGNRWSAIATHLPKRTDNEIKNYWNTHLKKRLAKMGIDPVTHKPKSGALVSVDGRSKSAANLNHMAQWESARLEAEARLVLESKLRTGGPPPAPPTSTRPPTSSSSSSPCLDVLSGAWQRVWPKSAPIDLESPTSTLAFSEMAIAGESNAEQTEWKCFRKTCFSMETGYTVSPEASSWLTESSAGGFAPGFPVRLLGEQQNSAEVCAEPDNAECGSRVDVEKANGEEDENKDYWNSILNQLVNSSSPPPVF